jgi:hypothetical protein
VFLPCHGDAAWFPLIPSFRPSPSCHLCGPSHKNSQITFPTPPQLQQPPWSVQTPPSARIQTLNSPLCARRHPSLNPPAQHSTLQTGRLLDMGQPVQVRGGVIIEPSINHHSSKWYRTGWKRPMLGVCRHSLASTFYLLNMLERFMLR